MSNDRRASQKNKTKGSDIPGFLKKTFTILENQDFFDTISWTNDGKSFKIKDVRKFEVEVLPKYFKHNKCTSFVRQLNMYDFHKIRQKDKTKEFKHMYFQRTKPELLARIQRKTSDSHPIEEDLLEKYSELSSRHSALKATHEQLLKEQADQESQLEANPELALFERAKEAYLLSKVCDKDLSIKEAALAELTRKFVQEMGEVMSQFPDSTKAVSEDETNDSSGGLEDEDLDDNKSSISELGKRIFEPWDFDYGDYAELSGPKKSSGAFSNLFGDLPAEQSIGFSDNEVQFQLNIEQELTSF